MTNLVKWSEVKSLSRVWLFATPWTVAYKARVLEWVAISFSRESSPLRDRTRVSCIADSHFTIWATREALPTQYIKKQRHYFANKGLSSQGYGFSSSHVWMWELDHKETWAPKN